MAKERGFTLLELMIVVAVLAIIAAIAIPALLQSRKVTNEGATIGSMRTITTANEQYRVRFGTFALALSDLSGALAMDPVLGKADNPPGKSGYLYTYAGTRNTWSVSAAPVVPGQTGDRYFFINESGVIRFSEAGPATTSDPAVE